VRGRDTGRERKLCGQLHGLLHGLLHGQLWSVTSPRLRLALHPTREPRR